VKKNCIQVGMSRIRKMLDARMLALPYFFFLQAAHSSSLTVISPIITYCLGTHIDEAGVAGFHHLSRGVKDPKGLMIRTRGRGCHGKGGPAGAGIIVSVIREPTELCQGVACFQSATPWNWRSPSTDSEPGLSCSLATPTVLPALSLTPLNHLSSTQARGT
jgi:hypothetical protein